MRILASAALALSTVLAVSAFSAPAQAYEHRDGVHHDRGHHNGDRHRHHRGGLKIGLGEDGIFISKGHRRHHDRRHDRRHHH